MSIFGKILAIFNVFAVIGVLALLAMDYNRTRAWQYAVFKQDVAINGLPLTREDHDDQGRPLYLNVNEEIKKELFPQGNPVLTQQEEVELVKKQVVERLQSVSDRDGQMVEYSRILFPFAVTAADRDRLLCYVNNLKDEKSRKELQARLAQANEQARKPARPAEAKAKTKFEDLFRDRVAEQPGQPIDPFVDALLQVMKANPAQPFPEAYKASLDAQHAELAGWLDRLFAEAVTPPAGSQLPAKEKPLLRGRIASLLFNLVEAVPQQGEQDNPGAELLSQRRYRRFFSVVGVEAATEAISEQARVLRAMVPQVETARLRDRGQFGAAQNRLIDIIRSRAAVLDGQTVELQRRQQELTAQKEALNKVKANVKEYTDELAAARKETARDMQTLRKMSQELYKLRVDLRDATQKTQDLEKELRELESER